MAKRKNKELDLDIDKDFDFEQDLDGLDGMFDMDTEEPDPGKREPVSKTVKKVGKGFTEGFVGDKSMDNALDIVNKTMPKSMSSEINEINQVYSDLKSKLSDSVKDIKRTSRVTLKTIDKIMPAEGRTRALLEKLKAKLGDEESSSYNAEQSQSEKIALAMTEVFGEQQKQDRLNDLLKQSIEEKRHSSSNELLSSINAHNEHNTSFHTDIANAYYRRSLELQYRSLFTATEQLNVLRGGMLGFKAQFESIIHNTALPDILKVRGTEMLKEQIAINARQQISDAFYSDVNPLMNLKKNALDKIGDITTGIKDGISGVNDMADMSISMAESAEMMGGKSKLYGNLVGSGIRDFLLGKAGEKLGATEKGKEAVYNFKDGAADINSYFGKKASETKGEGFIADSKRGIFSLLEELSYSNSKNRVNLSNSDPDDVTMFDNRTRDSIIKVIPGLLSKIYGEIKSLRTKDNDPVNNELYYDHVKNTFNTKSDYVKNVKRDIALKMNRGVVPSIDSLIQKYESEGTLTLSDKDKLALRKGITQFYLDGGSINPSTIVNKKFLAYFDRRLATKLKLGGELMLANGKQDPSYLDYISWDLKSIKSNLPNLGKLVNDLHKDGMTDIGSRLGLISKNERTGGYEYNQDGAKRAVASSIDDLSNEDIMREKTYLDSEKEKKRKLEDNFSSKVKNLGKRLKEGQPKKQEQDPKNKFKPNEIKETVNQKFSKVIDKITDTNEEQESGLSKIKTIFKTERDFKVSDISKLRTTFFTSQEYIDGTVDNFNTWLEKQNIKIKEKVLDDALKGEIKENIKTVSDKKDKVVDTVKRHFNKTLSTDEEINNAKEQFFKSKEYVSGYVEDFEQWVTSLGYTIKEPLLTTRKKQAKENIRKTLSNTRSLDKRMFFGGMNLLGKGIKNTVKLPWYMYKGAKGIGGKLLNAYNSKPVQGTLSKTRSLDKKMFNSIPSLLGGLLNTGLKAPGYAYKGLKGIKGGIGNALGLLLGFGGNKDKEKDKEKNTFDTDGNGRRDGDWRDRLDIFKNRKKPTATQAVSEKKPTTGIFDLLKKMLPIVMSGIGTIAKGMLGLPKLLMGIVPALGKLITSSGSAVLKAAGTVGTGALAAGKAVFGSKQAASVGLEAAGTASKAGNVVKPNKIMSILSSFKDKVVKKLGPVAGLRMGAIISAKIAARLVPIAGQALLAYDAVKITMLMIGGMSLASAVSTQILGSDIFNDEEALLDENGNPIKPDENLEIKEPKSTDNNSWSIFDKPKDKEGENVGESFYDKLKKHLNNAGGVIKDNVNALGSNLKEAGENVGKKAVAVKDKVITKSKEALESIKSGIGNFFKNGSFNNNALGAEKSKVLNMLDDVSATTGVDPNVLKTFAAVESSLNPNLKAGTSSASGLFQFLKSTWNNMLSKHAKKYDIDPNTSPFDPKANALMGAEFLKENANAIKSVRPNPSVTDLYLAHFLGAGGAKQFLKSSPDTIMADLMPAAARANKPIFYTKDGRPKTMIEIYQDMDSKMMNRALEYGYNPNAKQSPMVDNTLKETSTDTSTDTGTGTNTDVYGNNTPKTDSIKPVNNTNMSSVINDNKTSTPISSSTDVKPVSSTPSLNNEISASGGTSTPLNTQTDATKITLANDANTVLTSIDKTMLKMLEYQIKSTTALDRLVELGEISIKSSKLVPQYVDDKKDMSVVEAPKRANNTSTDFPTPAVGLKRKVY